MNDADFEYLENRVKRFISGEEEYLTYLRGLQDELRRMREEIAALRVQLLPWVEIPDEAILAHPQAQRIEWEE